MKVAVAYSDDDLSRAYPEDSEGRDTNETVQYAAESIESLGHTVDQMPLSLESLPLFKEGGFDVVFNLCDDGFFGESSFEPHVAAVLEILRIPYTGSGNMTLSVCLDKAYTKNILAYNGLPTPKFFVAKDSEGIDHDLEYPVIVKPVREDGSVGIKTDSVVANRGELKSKVGKILKTYRQPALVEEYVDGREFNVAILGNNEPETLPIAEIVFKGLEGVERIVSYNAKWLPESKQFKSTPGKCPANVGDELAEEMIRISERAYMLLGVRGYGRVDIRVGENGPRIIEVNPNPDLSADAGFFRSAKASGLSYAKLLEKIINLALEDKT